MRFLRRDTSSFQTLHSSKAGSTTSQANPAISLNDMSQRDTRRKSGSVEEIERKNSTDIDRGLILCATRGRIYAVKKQDGSKLWEKKFPKEKSWCIGGSSLITLFITDDNKYVLAGKNAKVACLDMSTGETRWVKKLPKSKWVFNEVCTVATSARSPRTAATALINAVQDHKQLLEPFLSGSSTTSRSSSTDSGLPSPPPPYVAASGRFTESGGESSSYRDQRQEAHEDRRYLIAATWGRCHAYDVVTGEDVWHFDCPKGGTHLPTLVVEPDQSHVYIGCGKLLYCLEIVSGHVRWTQKLSDARFGWGYMTLATTWSSRLAAEVHSGGFSQQPTAQAFDFERKFQWACRFISIVLAGGLKFGFMIANAV
ncbi:hypothetical protein BCR43DRAFT_527710 [Syncephalastrum racemosum]|uniref:Pyrrolo-quinoline quinone repeat domain-containing protein n=1 Tax=Syncephalastrum racemosum TaxID=13706 RepID=A0A1X2H0X3_SYNRA|nr:hypothetical protein BCR43DRAFT_527710 [Syncephalastrum racemosum]